MQGATVKIVNISRYALEKYSKLQFYKTHPVGTELLHADGETDGQTEEKGGES
jgi:hypothetical protein